MNSIEIAIINKIKELEEKKLTYVMGKEGVELTSLFNELLRQPLGKMDLEFIRNTLVEEYLKKIYPEYTFDLRLLIEKYLLSSGDEKVDFLTKIASYIQAIREKTFKANGQGLLPEPIKIKFIKDIYSSKDEQLIKLFAENLPIPKDEVFLRDNDTIPPFIQERTDKATKAVLNFLKNRASKGYDFKKTENEIIGIQRKFRANRRQMQEIHRLAEHPAKPYPLSHGFNSNDEFAANVLQIANTPYRPQRCPKELADRIVNAASKVKLFSEVKHITSEKFLSNIFDGGLFGRQTLLQNYIPFIPAALASCDLESGGGDANVICFGPQKIDPMAKQEDYSKLFFDVDKLGINPCIFYKQFDLVYDLKTNFDLPIVGDKYLKFTMSTYRRIRPRPGYVYLSILNNDNTSAAIAELPNFYFISYNITDMHKILTLNFFRFLDNLNTTTTEVDISKNIYDNINQLNEKELVDFLFNLGKCMIKSAEFNFYGAYKIDFAALTKITSSSSRFAIRLEPFIKDLQNGNQAKLQEVKQNLPAIFKSYRFIDYLLEKIDNNEIRKELIELRESAFNHKVRPLLIKQIHAIQKKQQQEHRKREI